MNYISFNDLQNEINGIDEYATYHFLNKHKNELLLVNDLKLLIDSPTYLSSINKNAIIVISSSVPLNENEKIPLQLKLSTNAKITILNSMQLYSRNNSNDYDTNILHSIKFSANDSICLPNPFYCVYILYDFTKEKLISKLKLRAFW